MIEEKDMIVDQYGKPLQRSTDLKEIARILAKEDAYNSSLSGQRPFRSNVWLYSVVSDIAASMADIPFGLWKRGKDASTLKFSTVNWVPVEDDPLADKLENPNPWQTKRRFLEQWATFLLTGGNAWVYKDEPDSSGLPRSLLLFGVDSVFPLRVRATEPPMGWRVRLPNGNIVDMPLDAMIHWALPNDFDPWMGIPPYYAVEFQLDADKARVMFDRYFFRNNATPDAVLTYKPGPLNKQSRDLVYESWYEAYGGPDKHGGIAVIGGDFDLKVLGIAHSQAQYIESRKFTRQEVASIYHYPVQLLNDIEGGGLGRDQLTIARMLKYENAVFPNAHRFAEGITSGLVRNYKQYRRYATYFDFDQTPVMVDFLSTKTKIFTEMVQNGIPVNVAVAKLDMGIDRVKGGDEGLFGKNFLPLTDATNPPPPPAPVAPAAPAAIPAPKAKPALPPKKQEFSPITLEVVQDGLEPLVENATRKIKRQFFNLRNDCFRNIDGPSPFDIEKCEERWQRSLQPVLVAAAQIGSDIAAGRTPWTLVTKNPIDDTINRLQNKLNYVTLSQNMILVEIDQQIKRSISILEELRKEILSADDREQQIHRSFNQLYDVARSLALQYVRWAMNAGCWMGRNGEGVRVASDAACHAEHGRYPGDSNLSFRKTNSCYCMVTLEA